MPVSYTHLDVYKRQEEQSGNREFAAAKAAQLTALEAMELPEVAFFLQAMLPAYTSTLDGLMKGGEEE